ncbi:hypothetical protein ACJZ2D_014237 [Fusarium nematophilum]
MSSPTPSSKKKYVTRACDACKKRKSKCDGLDPCERCLNVPTGACVKPVQQCLDNTWPSGKVRSDDRYPARGSFRAVHSEIVGDLTDDDRLFLDNFTEEQKKRVVWKLDIRLVPMLAFLYLIAFLDRANIGNAEIEGLV